MARLLILIYLGNSADNFDKKTFVKPIYLLETLVEVLSAFKWTI